MNIFKLISTPTLFALTIFSLVLITACENPASDNEHKHIEPAGLQLKYNGEVLFEYADGTLTEHKHMHLHVGEEYLFDVEFIGEHGEHIHADQFGNDYFLDWKIEDEEVLQIQQYEEDGPWSFHVSGVAEGGSKVQLMLMHGSKDHAHAHLETPQIAAPEAIEFQISQIETSEEKGSAVSSLRHQNLR